MTISWTPWGASDDALPPHYRESGTDRNSLGFRGRLPRPLELEDMEEYLAWEGPAPRHIQ